MVKYKDWTGNKWKKANVQRAILKNPRKPEELDMSRAAQV